MVTIPSLKKLNFSVSMVNTRWHKEQPETKDAAGEKLEKKKVPPLQKLI